MSKAIILESYIFPPVQYFQAYINASNVLIEKCDNYQKKSFRNRYVLDAPSDKLLLSIPISKPSRINMTEASISYEESWHKKHINAIRSNYGKSPYFEHYFDEVSSLLNSKYSSLLELNNKALELILRFIHVDPIHAYTENYKMVYEDTLYDDLRAQINPNNYEDHINKSYYQVFGNINAFKNNLSILDLIFNCGPESKFYL